MAGGTRCEYLLIGLVETTRDFLFIRNYFSSKTHPPVF